MSFGVALPISYDSAEGFRNLQSFRNTVRQNFKMLILTNPGERVMYPQFGVGIKRFLFDNYGDNVEARIRQSIISQTALYIPLIVIKNILFSDYDVDRNILNMRIIYSIPTIGLEDLIEFTI